MENKNWWKNAVIYQIYPKSFQDSNGDGIGDIPGIIQRLDYLKKLGIDAIWLSPVYQSPQDDNGYDISDYQNIDPMFGTLDDMKELIHEAGQRGIKIIMDLVLNHSSDEHRWFLEAKKSRTNPYHDYYVWRDGKQDTPPNDMKACFGGSAWEWVPEVQQYYFHQFSVKQPDLNWDNPKLREEIYQMIRWWIELGVGGFRLDVIDQIAKEPDRKITTNGSRLHEFIQELSKETFQKGDYLVTVGEAWGADPEIAKKFSNPDGSELSMVFQFEHMMIDQQPGKEKWDLAPFSLVKLKKILGKWQTQLGTNGWNSLFWNNHDLPRIVSRWGNDKEYRIESAKMLAIVLHGMQGTPYIYQGEELGMTNAPYDIEDYRDIELINIYQERMKKGYKKEDIMKSIHAKGRDNARTPMQWDDSKNAGFSDGTPWIKVNPNKDKINAKQELADNNSVFCFYQQLIHLRKTYDIFENGNYESLLEDNETIFSYLRKNGKEQLFIAANFSSNEIHFQIPEEFTVHGKIILHNYEGGLQEKLRAYEAVMILLEK